MPAAVLFGFMALMGAAGAQPPRDDLAVVLDFRLPRPCSK